MMTLETYALAVLNAVRAWLWRWRLPLVFSIAYLIFSSYAMLHFLHVSKLGDASRKASYEGMVEGTARKPFVQRMLIPKLTDIIADSTPVNWQEAFGNSLYPEFTENVANFFPGLLSSYPDAQSFYQRMITTALIYGFLIGYMAALWAMMKRFFPDDPALRWFVPIFGTLVIPSFSWPFQYIYDIPSLFFAAACFACIAAGRYRWYIILFMLACLNKESALFILVFFMVWAFRRMDVAGYIELSIIQILIWVGIKLFIIHYFQDARGVILEDHFYKVLDKDIFSRSNYARIVMIAVMFFLLTYRWAEKPLFFKYGLWLLPCIYVAYVFFGYPNEYRVFFDFMPFAVLLGTHTLISGTGISQSPFFKKESP